MCVRRLDGRETDEMNDDQATTCADDLRANARDYYGNVLQSSEDLKTSACCSTESVPAAHREILAQIHDEVLTRFYGCGSPIPSALDGATVLDLGCGTGRDVYLCSRLVGPTGRVIGLDMTDEQLEVARRHQAYQAEVFGHASSNVDFRKGYIEDLASAGIEDDSVDVVISNCVVNLSPDKERVLAEVFRVLKPGGELYFSDVYADRRVPAALRTHPVLHGECLSGAFYREDIRRVFARLGCPDVRRVAASPVAVTDPEVLALTGSITFESITLRAFKLREMEDRREDYGQTATYRGTDPAFPEVFVLDADHRFEAGHATRVCGNTAAMLQASRLARHFDVQGDRSDHRGLFTRCCGQDAAPPPATTRCC